VFSVLDQGLKVVMLVITFIRSRLDSGLLCLLLNSLVHVSIMHSLGAPFSNHLLSRAIKLITYLLPLRGISVNVEKGGNSQVSNVLPVRATD